MIKFLLAKAFWGFLQFVVSDKWYIILRYYLVFDRLPNLDNPSRFSEMLQKIKLEDRNPLRNIFADRIRTRAFVAEKVGDEFLIPLVGTFDTSAQIDWGMLPGSFAMKVNHGSSMNYIVQNKDDIDSREVAAILDGWQQLDYARVGREWAYSGLPRTIVVEELLKTADGEIPSDFKFWVFWGKVVFFQVDYGRFGRHTRNIYNTNGELLPVTLLHNQNNSDVDLPLSLNKASALAEKLGEDIDFVRVDLYIVDGKIYVGELTNYPGNGFERFTPDSFDRYLAECYLSLMHNRDVPGYSPG